MGFLDVIYIVILGIIEGITEWLPISSTGHLILADAFLADMVNESIITNEFKEMFNVVVQLGAIFAIIIIYFKKLWPFGFNEIKVKNPDNNFKLIEENTAYTKNDKWIIWAKVGIACLPAVIVGLFLNDYLEKVFNNPLSVSITLILYGIFFILIELWTKNRRFKINDVKELTFKYALIIGFIQLLSLIPGTSRSGVTILGAMLLLCSRSSAAEFSFFLSIPIMLGASLLKTVKFISSNTLVKEQVILLAIGMITALLVSIIIVKFLMSFIKKHGFTGFGIYRIILGIVVILCFLCNVI